MTIRSGFKLCQMISVEENLSQKIITVLLSYAVVSCTSISVSDNVVVVVL